MDLYENNLSGPIPAELGGMDSLRVLSLYGNRLSGRIPRELGNLSTLEIMRLQREQPQRPDSQRTRRPVEIDNPVTLRKPADRKNTGKPCPTWRASDTWACTATP